MKKQKQIYFFVKLTMSKKLFSILPQNELIAAKCALGKLNLHVYLGAELTIRYVTVFYTVENKVQIKFKTMERK